MTPIPSTSTIYSRLLTALESAFSITVPTWGRNFLRALCLVFSREFRLQYMGQANIQKNTFIDTCDPEMVVRYGSVKLGRLPFPATQGTYTVAVTGTIGATIRGQTTFKSDDSSESPGLLFILDSPFVLTATTDYINLTALTEGTGSRLAVGDTLTSTTPLINVSIIATVTVEVVIPNDAETVEQYRAKGLASYRLLPSGDNSVSYREEGSLNVNGVQQIYPYATSGSANEIDLYIEAIAADSTDGKGTPTATIITDVTAAVETNRPLGVFLVNYYPITLKQVDVNINMTGYTALTTAQKALVQTAVTLFLAGVRPFIAAADTLASRKDAMSNFNLVPAIAQAIPGIPFGAVTFEINTVPVTEYTFDNGAIPWLNTPITYV